MIKEIEEYFEKNGYKKYPQQHIVYPYSDYFWQKKIEDGIGVKYFIQFVYYSPILDEKEGKFMAEIVNNGDINTFHQTYRIHSLDKLNDIIRAEKMIEEFFLKFGNYYEA